MCLPAVVKWESLSDGKSPGFVNQLYHPCCDGSMFREKNINHTDHAQYNGFHKHNFFLSVFVLMEILSKDKKHLSR